jgi:hypothetical protein
LDRFVLAVAACCDDEASVIFSSLTLSKLDSFMDSG